MDRNRYEEAGRIFHQAMELPAGERPAVVRRACDGDEQLRSDVESLLAAHEQAGQFIESPAIEVAAALLAADEAASAPPSRIGRYEILSLIARGGMGAVYEARDAQLGRRVALKLPRRTFTSDPSAVAQFEHEARAASSLNHPNIVTIHEIGGIGDGRFIAMELVEGQSLAAMVGSPVPPALLTRIGRQVAQALSVAHGAGIVHGDIKPENVMVRSDGYVKVLDFGLARLLSGKQEPHSRPAFGTPRYVSPEQARGETASTASDIFACGLVLYELATGHHPFISGAAEHEWHANSNPEAVALSLAGGLPLALQRLLTGMLEQDAGRRPTARQVELELSALEASPPLDRQSAVRNLPAQRTPFVGRSAEIDALESMLLDPESRLVTLTGTGGTGKTRLALHVVSRIAGRFDGGVSFVNLAPISDPALVPGTIAHAHGVREVTGRPLVAVLCEHLRERGRLLLLLDNFEQVAAAASLIKELLDACHALTVLVTSRLVLHLYGEREFAVPPLPVPDAEYASERLMDCASVALFVQRAAAVKPDFALTAKNAGPVVEICRRLDGLPLAIELAAARAKILAPSELLARLEHRLDLPGGGPQDRPARQQTLRSAIGWSYFLLPPPEQMLFRRLSVFVGGCTLEAIEAVCNATEDLGIDVLAGVSALVDNSLLIPRTSGDEQSRFFMLETVREYARERLDASGETPATRRAHAAYALVVAEEESSGMAPADREAWLLWCDREHDNLRAAMQYLVATAEAEWALRLGSALFRFWEQREYLTEGREALAAALAIPAPSPPGRARAAALYNACLLADIQCDRVTAQAMVRQAHAIYETLGDIKGVATTMFALARQAHVRGLHAEARSLLEETVGLWDRVGERPAADMARSNIATFAKADGDYDLAWSLFEQLVASASARGDRRALASALNELGDLAARSDDALARRHHHESLAIFREIGDSWGIARVLTDLAHVDIAAGDCASAEELLKEALQLARDLGHQRGVARRLELLSWCAGLQSHHGAAIRLAGAASVIRERIGVPAEPAEGQKLGATMNDARRALGARASEQAWLTGRLMTVDQVIASISNPPC